MISVVIPVFNEAKGIESALRTVIERAGAKHEILLVDGGSTDDTVNIGKRVGVTVLACPRKGRGIQMNYGARHAKGEILYFLHADSIPPADFGDIIQHHANRYDCGCFRLKFDDDHWFLRTNAWFTRFDVNGVRFGDQSLFVKKDLFESIGGFREDLMVMEDQEIIHRLKEKGKFIVMKESVVTSARRYRANGIFRLQFTFYCIWTLYYLGMSQEGLVRFYKRFIRS